MPLQPDTDQQLAKASGRLAANGVTVGGRFAIGLATPVTVGALMLGGSGAVGRRAAQRKDFA